MSKTILITGGLGFIGSNFIRLFLKAHPSCHIINLDKLTYSANPENLMDLSSNPQYHFIQGDIMDEALLHQIGRDFPIQAVVHFAAESHVDRSISGSREFIQTNVLGTHTLLEVFKRYWDDTLGKDPSFRFLNISTDEVYGTLGLEGHFTEQTAFKPNSPYSASKAGADLLVRAYFETYGFPILIVRPSNNYGPYQFPEKFIPLMITNLLEDRPIPVYGRGENIRDWLFVEDACQAIDQVLFKGRPGEAYNIGGESERSNIEVARQVLSFLKKGEEFLQFVTDRPGHDLRYALSNAKIKKEIGWHPTVNFSEGLTRTIQWYQDQGQWWKPLKERLQEESKGFWSKS
ncbi:MAG: dTDP-glucose 4,6-dehydratase [Deltaproteobacteria bacterium]|nr:dTDP-glucose 4,6-dehydratase [Deltaproteobacteria bacterium]